MPHQHDLVVIGAGPGGYVAAIRAAQLGQKPQSPEFSASAEDIARSSHAQPTLAEVMKEAGLSVDRRAIHI